MVGEQGGQAVEQHGRVGRRGRDRAVPGPARPWGTARAGCGSRARAHPVGGARRRPRSVAVTSTKNASWRSATRSQDGLYALGSMAVPKASTAAAAVGWRARARGSSPRERLAVSGPSRSGRLVSPATTPASLVANHVPPPTSSRPPRIASPPPAPSRRVIGTVGRARRSSRLAATISGIPGTTPLITINRHIGRSVRARRLAPRGGLEWRPRARVPQPAGATRRLRRLTTGRVSSEPTPPGTSFAGARYD